jgi:hypothetical protein
VSQDWTTIWPAYTGGAWTTVYVCILISYIYLSLSVSCCCATCGCCVCSYPLFGRVKFVTWEWQVNVWWSYDLCSRVHYSLRNLSSASVYISSELKLRMVKALIIQFLFGDVLFRIVDSTGLRKLEVAYNNWVWFVYGLRRYDHVAEYSRNILGCSLSKYYEFRACCMLFKKIKTTYPSYLNENLFFDSSRRRHRLLCLTTPS